MYHPTSRVLAVLGLLQAHGRMSGAELARRLEVNVRTLRRYITTLQDLGIPIVADRGRSGAYELGANYKLPPMLFTNDEALVLQIGLLAAAHLGLAERTDAIESARAKLEAAMPLELKTRAHTLSEVITLDLDAYSPPMSSRIMLLMSAAAQQKRRVHLHYYARSDQESERDFDPYGIVYRQGSWYIVGWCHLRQAMRSFRLDRITEAQATDIYFDPVEDFDALAYIEHAFATLERQYNFEILLKADMVTIRKHVFTMLGIFEPHPDGIVLRGTTDDLPWLARILAGFPFEFVIHQPVELRLVLHEHAARLSRIAAQNKT